ncbi:sulfate permease-like transporter, MFS superfamily [Halobacteroides halobius DSM 5150]|uniref:Sulfate permease-like transporter, MFS superfamily n=1 Tax=Halobacteroides halobius (strain ATCC 35273 / DSM 5150 / MD-1) TaxID=748449 RepID=L0KBU7_HALHC|nr:SulP family inorganic anion transporter [Halobacteroides halobius]AGB41568.1 sulfate permease-like transporter, MFS superfamily [Halobacteroides halobius DSM 5150]
MKNYNLTSFKDDITAGASVAALSIPQNMAYALIVGVNPIYGIYTSVVSKLIASLVGVSNHMIVGPTNLMSMAIASNLDFVADDNYFSAVLVLTFLVGVFQILFGLFKLGKLVNYISHPVIVGLTTGTAIIIGVGQLSNLFQLSIPNTANIFMTLYFIFGHLEAINPIALSLGLVTIISIIISEIIDERYPTYLVAIAISTLVVYYFGLVDQIKVIGKLPGSLPQFDLPRFDFTFISEIYTKALSVAIVGLIQTLAVVKSLENRSGEEVKVNKEFLGQGLVNLGTSFYNGFASAGSFTNSFINYQAGAKTKLAQTLTAIIIILFIIIFNPILKYIPIASLAALVIVVAMRMIDLDEVIQIFKATKSDLLIFSVTLLATIGLPRLEYAIYLGVLISLGIVLRESSKVNMSHISYDEESDTKLSYTEPEKITEDEYIVIDLIGDLNFSAAENFKEELNSVTAKGFIFRIKNIGRIDITTVKELEKFITKVQKNEKQVFLSGIEEEHYEVLDNLGIIDMIGEDNIFHSKEELLSSTIEAVKSAEDNK